MNKTGTGAHPLCDGKSLKTSENQRNTPKPSMLQLCRRYIEILVRCLRRDVIFLTRVHSTSHQVYQRKGKSVENPGSILSSRCTFCRPID